MILASNEEGKEEEKREEGKEEKKMEEGEEGKKEEKMEGNKINTCPVHPGQPLIFYCENDDKLCCAKCNISSEHSDHILYGIEEYRNTVRAKLEAVVQNYDDDVRKLEHLQDMFTQYYDQNDMTWEAAATKVKETFYRLHSILEEQEKGIIQYLEVKKQFSNIDEQFKSVENDLSQIDRVYGDCINTYEQLKEEGMPLSKAVKAVENLGEYNKIHQRAQEKVVLPNVNISFNPMNDNGAQEQLRMAWGGYIKVDILNTFKGPKSVRVESVQGNMAKIVWDPIDIEYKDSAIYQVEISRAGNANALYTQTVVRNTSTVFRDLALDSDFNVRVRGGINSTQNVIWSDWSEQLTFRVVGKQLTCNKGHQLIRSNTNKIALLKKGSSDKVVIPPFECCLCGKLLDCNKKDIPKQEQAINTPNKLIKTVRDVDDDDDDDNEGFNVFDGHNEDDSETNTNNDKENGGSLSTGSEQYDVVWSCPKCDFIVCDECATYELTHNFVGARCSKFHKLSRMSIRKLLETETNDKSVNSDVSIACNICRKDVTNHPGMMVFHCSRCDYDLCCGCAEELMQDKYRVIVCFMGHRLQKLFIDDRLGRRSWCKCDLCKAHLLKGSMVRVFYCKACGFDMCETCAESRLVVAANAPDIKCPRNHSLIYTLLGQRVAITGSSIKCKVCSKVMNLELNRAAYPIMTCRQCGYDVCAECSGLRIN